MYNFEKLTGEEILLISDDSILKEGDHEITISTIITDKRLLLLDYPSKSNNYEEALRTSRGVDYISKKEPILIIKLKDIDKIIEEDKFDKYLLNDSNYFCLKDEKTKNKLNELL